MRIQTYLQKNAKAVTKELHVYLDKWHSTTNTVAPKLHLHKHLFAESIFGGKMLRSALVKIGYELTNAKKTNAIIKPAAAFEILHTALLIHDDIIDKSDLRRGKPTLYKALGGDHVGISHAICLGDIGFFLATKLITQSDFKEELKNHAIQTLSNSILHTIIGEMLDVEIPHRGKKRLEEDVLTIHRLKTADYTVVAPMSIGAILGNGSELLLKRIHSFGENVGIAYQLQDDILGVFGSQQIVGKSVTSDIEEGKNTILFTYSLQKATPLQKRFLLKYYGKGKITDIQHKLIKKVFIDTGALNYSEKKIAYYIGKAKKDIPFLTKEIHLQKLLEDLVILFSKRQR